MKAMYESGKIPGKDKAAYRFTILTFFDLTNLAEKLLEDNEGYEEVVADLIMKGGKIKKKLNLAIDKIKELQGEG